MEQDKSRSSRIVLCYPAEEKHLRQIAAAMPGAEIANVGQDRVAEELFEADVFCGQTTVPVDWDGIMRQGRLRWIQSSCVGVDHFMVPAVIESDVAVTTASGISADQVAEHAVALMIAWARSLPLSIRGQQKKEFVRRPMCNLTGSTVGIVGFGGIGRRLAELVAPFRTHVFAVDLYPVDPPNHIEALWPADRLNDVLPLVDFLVLALPLTDATRHVIDAAALARMKPGSLLVNIARGPLVVHDDLVAALRLGRPAGAALDVTDPEPLPPTSPLWEMPNVIITPHAGCLAAWRIDRITELFCQNLQRWQSDLPLINRLADKRLGFPIRGGKYPLWSDPYRICNTGPTTTLL
jgi:phosphoglycerate dehydrogenase-like enzyme